MFTQKYSDSNNPASEQIELVEEVQVETTNCHQIYDYDNNERGNLVTRFKDICEFKYTYTFPDAGLSPNGQILSSYSFSFYILDLAGNVPVKTPNSGTALRPNINYKLPENILTSNLFKPTTITSNNYYDDTGITNGDNFTTIGSIYSETLTIYHDTDNPDDHNIRSMTDGNGFVAFFPFDSITRTTAVNTEHIGERLSDVQYQLSRTVNNKSNEKINLNPNPNNYQDQFTKIIQNSYEGNGWSSHQLGKQERDEVDPNCISMQGRRRIGTCDDGIYSVKMRMIDTAGNNGEWENEDVERDTTNPAKPEISVSKTGDIVAEYLALSIASEGRSTADVKIVNEEDGNVFTKSYYLGDSGLFSTTNLVGLLECGSVSYTIKVKITDRAGNIGEESTASITTEDCPSCGGIGADPLQGNFQISNHFGHYKSRPNIAHYGIDYVQYAGANIYSVKEGRVIFANYGYTDDYGKPFDSADPNKRNGGGFGNYVTIDHGSGIIGTYAHLKPEAFKTVNVGDIVSKGQVIGRMGTTGFSTGPHLHFEIKVNGIRLDPQKVFDKEGVSRTNLTPEQAARFGCQEITDEEENAYPEIPESEAKAIMEAYKSNFMDSDQSQYQNGIQNWCGVWWQDLGSFKQKNGNTGYDGGIFINPYSRKAYIVQNALFLKYYSDQGPCSATGVPRDTERVAFVRLDSKAVPGASYYQMFEKGGNTQNALYFYKHRFSFEETSANTVRKVATDYHKAGGSSSSYKFAVADTGPTTGDDKYCYQSFEGGLIDLCPGSSGDNIDNEDNDGIVYSLDGYDMSAATENGANVGDAMGQLWEKYKGYLDRASRFFMEPYENISKCSWYDAICISSNLTEAVNRLTLLQQKRLEGMRDGLKDGVIQFVVDIWETIKSIFQGLWNIIKQVGKLILNYEGFKQDLQNQWNSVVELWNTLSGKEFWESTLVGVLDSIGELLSKDVPQITYDMSYTGAKLVPDIVIGFFTGSASIWARAGMYAVKLASKVPILLKGINLLRGFVGKTFEIIKGATVAVRMVRDKIVLFIDDVVNVIKQGVRDAIDAVKKLLPKGTADAIDKLGDTLAYCATNIIDVTYLPIEKRNFDVFAFVKPVQVNASINGRKGVCQLTSHKDSHWDERHFSITEDDLKRRAFGDMYDSKGNIINGELGRVASKYDISLEEVNDIIKKSSAQYSKFLEEMKAVGKTQGAYTIDLNKSVGHGFVSNNGTTVDKVTNMRKIKVIVTLDKNTGEFIKSHYPSK